METQDNNLMLIMGVDSVLIGSSTQYLQVLLPTMPYISTWL